MNLIYYRKQNKILEIWGNPQMSEDICPIKSEPRSEWRDQGKLMSKKLHKVNEDGKRTKNTAAKLKSTLETTKEEFKFHKNQINAIKKKLNMFRKHGDQRIDSDCSQGGDWINRIIGITEKIILNR